MPYDICFELQAPINLGCFAADNQGGQVTLPNVFDNRPGLYLVLNQSLGIENRYMGITSNIRD